jgi:hypothetical protein
MRKEAEKLVKESGFTKAIDFFNIFAISKIFGYTDLVFECDAPGKSFDNFLRGICYQAHG